MKLYKYARIDQRLFENLTHATLWFSNAQSFNDPYDCKSPVIYGATQAQLERYLTDVMQAGLSELHLGKSISELLTEWNLEPEKIERDLKDAAVESCNRMGLLSLSSNGLSIPMWSHYADGHKGVCLEFDTTEGFIFQDKPPYKVNYPPDQHYQKYFEEEKDAKTTLLGLALTKSHEWKYEEECRIFQNHPGLYPFNPEKLTGLLFGYYASSRSMATVRRILDPHLFPNLRIGRMILDKETYSLKAEY